MQAPPPPERPTSLPSDPSSSSRDRQLDTPGSNSRTNATLGPRSGGVRRKALGYHPKSPPGPTPPRRHVVEGRWSTGTMIPRVGHRSRQRLDVVFRALSEPPSRPPSASASTPPSTVGVRPRPCSPKPRGSTSPPSVGLTVSHPPLNSEGPTYGPLKD